MKYYKGEYRGEPIVYSYDEISSQIVIIHCGNDEFYSKGESHKLDINDWIKLGDREISENEAMVWCI